MTLCIRLLAVALAALVAASARAEVRQASAESMLLVYAEHLDAPPAVVYAALGNVSGWWSDAHTYSGKAANMSLVLRAGGCFCEHWPRGSVEHGRVLLALQDRMLRLDAPLGPLQARAVATRLTFDVKPADGGGTALAVTYAVDGTVASGLDKLAVPVDGVLGEQVRRLKSFVETGKPST